VYGINKGFGVAVGFHPRRMSEIRNPNYSGSGLATCFKMNVYICTSKFNKFMQKKTPLDTASPPPPLYVHVNSVVKCAIELFIIKQT